MLKKSIVEILSSGCKNMGTKKCPIWKKTLSLFKKQFKKNKSMDIFYILDLQNKLIMLPVYICQ